MLERAIGNDVELLYTNSLTAAQTLVRTTPELAMVICGIHFDESRMHDLLRFVRGDFPELPFLGVRLLDQESRRSSVAAAAAATQALGALGFVDFARMSHEVGAEQAQQHLRQLILENVRGPGKSPK